MVVKTNGSANNGHAKGEENMLGDHSYKYLTADEMKSLGDDSMPIDVTHDEKQQHRDTLPHPQQIKTNGSMIVNGNSTATSGSIEAKLLQMEQSKDYSYNEKMYAADNVDLPVKTGVNIGSRVPSHLSVATSCGNKSVTSMWRERFLVSFMVDARGGAMRGCRHSGVRVIIPPRKAPMPMRITCRYLKKDKLIHPPPLMEGEAIASRILELGPAGAKFLGPVIIEVPHFASLRGKEREIVILRSDNGETWKEHTLEATEDAVQDVLQESFDADEMNQLEDLNTNRITRILTTDFPQYFAIVSRIRQEVHAIGPDGGVVNSTVVPQVQAVFPHGALTKKIKVGLQAQPIPPELTAKLLGNRVAVSPIVTVEPRRRKFHKAITLTIPLPQASGKGMLNDYSSGSPPNSLRLLCSITGGTTRAQWEDVTGSTPLTFVKDCVNFTTTVSARFWLMDCRNIGEATKFATELYREAIHVPFMAKFVVFAKRHDVHEARLRVFCMTDDKEEKTLENQEHFTEVAKSRDVEVLEGTSNFIEFGGNLVPVTKSGEQLSLRFWAFRENRLPFTVKVKDPHSEAMGRIAFMKEPKLSKQEAPQTPICNLNVDLPSDITPEPEYPEAGEEYMALQKKHQFLRQAGYGKFDTIHRADLRISDIGNLLGSDWVHVAKELEIDDSDINIIKAEYPNNEGQQGMVMLRLWLNTHGNRATGNELEKALRACNRDDIVDKCMFNVEMVTDAFEKQVAKNQIQEDVPAARLLAAPLKRVDAISEDEDEVHETITTTSYEEKQGHDQIITEKQQSVVESENGETITTTTTTTTKRVISSEEEYEKSQFDSSYERDEAKYVAEEKDPNSRRESSESEEEEHEEEEEHIEVIEETQTEVSEVPKRTSTPPPSPLTKHEPMEEFQQGTEPSLEEAVQIAAKDISDEAEVAIPVVEERREYHEEEKSSSTRSSESHAQLTTRVDHVEEHHARKETSHKSFSSSSTTVGFVHVESSGTLPKSVEIGSGKFSPDSEISIKEKYHSELTEKETRSSSSTKSYLEKRKILMLVQEHEGSPMDSPMTESGQWTESGISTAGESSGLATGKAFKPQILDLQDQSIDTDADLSDMSPMGTEVAAAKTQLSPIHSQSSESPKQSTEKFLGLSVASTASPESPAQWKSVLGSTDKETDVQSLVDTADANLSPILFTESKATSPMSAIESRYMVDATSSPPKRVLQSASTSPPKAGDLDSIKNSPASESARPTIGSTDQPGSFEFEMDMDSSHSSSEVKAVKTGALTESTETKEYRVSHESSSHHETSSSTSIVERTVVGIESISSMEAKVLQAGSTKIEKETTDFPSLILERDPASRMESLKLETEFERVEAPQSQGAQKEPKEEVKEDPIIEKKVELLFEEKSFGEQQMSTSSTKFENEAKEPLVLEKNVPLLYEDTDKQIQDPVGKPVKTEDILDQQSKISLEPQALDNVGGQSQDLEDDSKKETISVTEAVSFESKAPSTSDDLVHEPVCVERKVELLYEDGSIDSSSSKIEFDQEKKMEISESQIESTKKSSSNFEVFSQVQEHSHHDISTIQATESFKMSSSSQKVLEEETIQSTESFKMSSSSQEELEEETIVSTQSSSVSFEAQKTEAKFDLSEMKKQGDQEPETARKDKPFIIEKKVEALYEDGALIQSSVEFKAQATSQQMSSDVSMTELDSLNKEPLPQMETRWPLMETSAVGQFSLSSDDSLTQEKLSTLTSKANDEVLEKEQTIVSEEIKEAGPSFELSSSVKVSKTDSEVDEPICIERKVELLYEDEKLETSPKTEPSSDKDVNEPVCIEKRVELQYEDISAEDSSKLESSSAPKSSPLRDLEMNEPICIEKRVGLLYEDEIPAKEAPKTVYEVKEPICIEKRVELQYEEDSSSAEATKLESSTIAKPKDKESEVDEPICIEKRVELLYKDDVPVQETTKIETPLDPKTLPSELKANEPVCIEKRVELLFEEDFSAKGTGNLEISSTSKVLPSSDTKESKEPVCIEKKVELQFDSNLSESPSAQYTPSASEPICIEKRAELQYEKEVHDSEPKIVAKEDEPSAIRGTLDLKYEELSSTKESRSTVESKTLVQGETSETTIHVKASQIEASSSRMEQSESMTISTLESHQGFSASLAESQSMVTITKNTTMENLEQRQRTMIEEKVSSPIQEQVAATTHEIDLPVPEEQKVTTLPLETSTTKDEESTTFFSENESQSFLKGDTEVVGANDESVDLSTITTPIEVMMSHGRTTFEKTVTIQSAQRIEQEAQESHLFISEKKSSQELGASFQTSSTDKDTNVESIKSTEDLPEKNETKGEAKNIDISHEGITIPSSTIIPMSEETLSQDHTTPIKSEEIDAESPDETMVSKDKDEPQKDATSSTEASSSPKSRSPDFADGKKVLEMTFPEGDYQSTTLTQEVLEHAELSHIESGLIMKESVTISANKDISKEEKEVTIPVIEEKITEETTAPIPKAKDADGTYDPDKSVSKEKEETEEKTIPDSKFDGSFAIDQDREVIIPVIEEKLSRESTSVSPKTDILESALALDKSVPEDENQSAVLQHDKKDHASDGKAFTMSSVVPQVEETMEKNVTITTSDENKAIVIPVEEEKLPQDEAHVKSVAEDSDQTVTLKQEDAKYSDEKEAFASSGAITQKIESSQFSNEGTSSTIKEIREQEPEIVIPVEDQKLTEHTVVPTMGASVPKYDDQSSVSQNLEVRQSKDGVTIEKSVTIVTIPYLGETEKEIDIVEKERVSQNVIEPTASVGKADWTDDQSQALFTSSVVAQKIESSQFSTEITRSTIKAISKQEQEIVIPIEHETLSQDVIVPSSEAGTGTGLHDPHKSKHEDPSTLSEQGHEKSLIQTVSQKLETSQSKDGLTIEKSITISTAKDLGEQDKEIVIPVVEEKLSEDIIPSTSSSEVGKGVQNLDRSLAKDSDSFILRQDDGELMSSVSQKLEISQSQVSVKIEKSMTIGEEDKETVIPVKEEKPSEGVTESTSSDTVAHGTHDSEKSDLSLISNQEAVKDSGEREEYSKSSSVATKTIDSPMSKDEKVAIPVEEEKLSQDIIVPTQSTDVGSDMHDPRKSEPKDERQSTIMKQEDATEKESSQKLEISLSKGGITVEKSISKSATNDIGEHEKGIVNPLEEEKMSEDFTKRTSSFDVAKVGEGKYDLEKDDQSAILKQEGAQHTIEEDTHSMSKVFEKFEVSQSQDGLTVEKSLTVTSTKVISEQDKRTVEEEKMAQDQSKSDNDKTLNTDMQSSERELTDKPKPFESEISEHEEKSTSFSSEAAVTTSFTQDLKSSQIVSQSTFSSSSTYVSSHTSSSHEFQEAAKESFSLLQAHEDQNTSLTRTDSTDRKESSYTEIPDQKDSQSEKDTPSGIEKSRESADRSESAQKESDDQKKEGLDLTPANQSVVAHAQISSMEPLQDASEFIVSHLHGHATSAAVTVTEYVREQHQIVPTDVKEEQDETEEYYYSESFQRDTSVDSFGNDDMTRSDDIDEMLVVVMPPGRSKQDVMDQSDQEFDEVNAPRIMITPSFDEGTDSLSIDDNVMESFEVDKSIAGQTLFEEDEAELEAEMKEDEEQQPEIEVSPGHGIADALRQTIQDVVAPVIHCAPIQQYVSGESPESGSEGLLHSEEKDHILRAMLGAHDFSEKQSSEKIDETEPLSPGEMSESEIKDKSETMLSADNDGSPGEASAIQDDILSQTEKDHILQAMMEFHQEDAQKEGTKDSEDKEQTPNEELKNLCQMAKDLAEKVTEPQKTEAVEEFPTLTELARSLAQESSQSAITTKVTKIETRSSGAEELPILTALNQTLVQDPTSMESIQVTQSTRKTNESEVQVTRVQRRSTIDELPILSGLAQSLGASSRKPESAKGKKSDRLRPSKSMVEPPPVRLLEEVKATMKQEDGLKETVVTIEKQVRTNVPLEDVVPTLSQMTAHLLKEGTVHDFAIESDEEVTTVKTPVGDFRLMESFRAHFVQDFDFEAPPCQEFIQSPEEELTLKDCRELREAHFKTEADNISNEGRTPQVFSPKKMPEEEQDESGFEIMSREGQSLDDSAFDPGNDTLLSDRTDSLLRGSTLVDSFISDRTLSSHTLEAELPSDGEDLDTDAESPALKRRKEQLSIMAKTVIAETQVEVLMSQVSQVAKDIKAEVKELKPDLAPTPELKEVSATIVERKSIQDAPEDEGSTEVTDVSIPSQLDEVTLQEMTLSNQSSAEAGKKTSHIQIESKLHETRGLRKANTELSDMVGVQMTPILNWTPTTESQDVSLEARFPPSKFKVDYQEGTELDPNWLKDVTGESTSSSDGSRITKDDILSSSPRTFTSTSSSSAMSYEREGTQSSIESHTTSRSSDQSGVLTTDSHESRSTKTSSYSSSRVSKMSTASSEHDYYSRTSESSEARESKDSSPMSKSPVEQLKTSSQDESSHSMPSSPLKGSLEHTHEAKKVTTSELFSTESDISRSLDLVYKEPGEDPKEIFKQQYSRSSSDGSTSQLSRLEKRKPSVTQFKKTSSSSSSSEDIETRIRSVDELPRGEIPPPCGKKTPSPTKIKHPMSTVGVKEQVSEEKISPVLEVRVHTPEKAKKKGIASKESKDEVDERMAENEAEVQESGFDTQQLGHAPPSTLPERRSSTSSSSSKSSSDKGDQEHDVELDRDDSLDDEMIVHEDEAPLGDPAQAFHEQELQEPERLSVSIQEEDEDEGEGDDYYEGEIESKRQPMASSTPAKSMTHGSSSASVSHSNSPSPDNNPPARPPNSISSIPSHLFVDNHMVSNMSADSMFVNVASESEFVADDTVEDTAEEFDQGDDDSLQFMVVEEKSESHLHAEHREEVSEPVFVIEEKQTCDQFAVDGAELREEVDEPMCVEKRVELLYDDEDFENNKEVEKEEDQKSLENEQEVESDDEPDHERLSSPSPIRESDDVERDDYYEGEVETKGDSPKSRSRSSSSTSSSPPQSSSRKSSKSSISAKGTSETHEEVDDHQTTTTITKTTITTTTTTNYDDEEDDDSDDEVDQNSDDKDSIIPRSDSDFRPEQAQTQGSITPDLPLPETLCGTNIPTRNSTDQEEETTFGDKKKFWEQMSSTESMASSGSDHNLEVKATGVASAQSPMTDIPEENVASVEISTIHSKKINVDELSFSAIKSEWTKEELAEQLTPERKEHFETFVKPALEEDSNESSMEDKKMPLHSERSSLDKDKFVTMQIKGDILESELDQQEESVMSEHFIEQNNTTIVSDTVTRQTVSYEATEDQRTRIVTNVTITETDLSGQLTETRERSERSVPEMEEPMPMTHVIESHEIVEKTSANGSSKLRVHISSDSLLVDDDQLRQNRISTPHPVKKSIIITAPSEEDEEQDEDQDQSQDDEDDSALEDPTMDLKTARDIASEVVANVGQEALKKVEEIRRSQEELDFEKSMPKPTVEVTFDEYFVVEDIPDEYDQIEVEEVQSVPDVDHQSQAHNMEEVRKVAQEFVEGIEEQAKEMAEKISPMGTDSETIRQQIETEKWHEEEKVAKSPVPSQASKAMHSEISLDISDSDLQADLTEVQDELKRHYSEVEVDSDEISASELHKSEGLELRREIAEGFEDVQDRLNAVVDQVVMGEVSYHHYVPSHFPTITSFRSHFVRPFDGQDLEGISYQNLSSVPIIASDPAEHQQEPPSEFQVFGSVQSHSVQDQSSTFISSTNSEDIWASEAKVMLRKDRIDHTKKSSEHDSSSSNSKLHRRSGTDFESGGGWSSSGDNYVTATASASALSRPSSSDMEAMYSAMSSAKSSTLTADYETAHGSSTHSALSTDYFTAVSSMTSKDSLRSLDTSESSGCLGSVEVSETTEPSEMLMDHSIHSERDLITPTGAPMEEFASHSPIVSTMTPLVEDTSETDDEARSPVILPNMKRSVEMVFNDVSESADKAMHELSESRETLNASILTISSGSEVTVQEIKESSNPATAEESFLAQGATPEESRCGSRESYQFPRVVSFETSVFDGHGHSELRGQKSFDSEFGSRPESELKILESRPQSMSEAMFSRSSSEDQRPSSKEDMSDSELPIMLKVKSDPFDRPVTPEPCYEEEEEIIEGDEEQEHLGITQAVELDTESEVEHNVEFIPGVEIMHAYAKDDDLLVESPPIKSKPVSVSYWPPPASDEDHEETKGLLDNEEVYYTEDVEEEKEWLARQFDGENKVTIEDEGFYYSPPLDQIVEEEEDHEKDMERLKTCLKESKEFDTSRFRRLDQMKATDRDDVSMSSLQEFEKLESQVSTCGGSRSSFGSQDSLEAGPIKVMKKNSKGDDISVDSYASLQEFEKLEQACHDVVVIEKMAKEQEDVLSEIEEGHESLYSESTDSAETLSEACPSEDDNSDDFEERMFQIDEIIKQAQSNVEQFSTSTSQQPFRQTEMLPLEDILGRNDSNTDSTGADKTPSAGTPESDSLEASPPKEGYHCASYRKSVLSVSSAARDQDQMQTSVDSLDMNRHTNVMETSIDSLDGRPVTKGPENIMALSTDSIEQDSNNMYAMTKSTDSLEGNGVVKPGVMVKSTDSLEESMATCSNNTRATASMLSSGASDTLVDDLEYDPAKAHPGMKKMLLASGEIHISDSDDNSISSKDTVDISHSQVSFGHHVREVIRTSGGDEEYSQVIERTIELPADVSRVSFRGPHAEEKMREYMSQFGADDDVQETEYVDEKGNVVKKKVVQHRIVANNSKPRSQGDQFKETEKFDSSCEEFYEEVDEEGNKKQYVIKRSVEPVVQATKTIEVIAERRLQQGVKNPMELNIFKSGESTFQGSGSQGYWSEDVKGSQRGSASDVDDVIQRKMPTGHNEGESHA